ncbi:haloacid dehalogenase type II [Myxozyma melibiosi]|uniref:Haloacid dehalogenase type II n=1 Tax=Myxozyma melibiosi TaxID=54550 RepID=A0ABR1EZP8_9ASCO
MPAEIKALLFDVFGTVVDWRSSVREYMKTSMSDAALRESIDWDAFAEEWRVAYYKYTKSNAKADDTTAFETVDQQHRKSLGPLAERYGLTEVWGEDDLDHVADAWHFLDGWSDTVEGLTLLKSKFIISTLSNGNVKLQVDMAKYAKLPWDLILAGDIFKIYKPSPKVYLGAVEMLQLKPENVLMVAAHIYDLQAAASLGLKTAYIDREGEDAGITVTPDQVDYYATDFIDLYRQLTQ